MMEWYMLWSGQGFRQILDKICPQIYGIQALESRKPPMERKFVAPQQIENDPSWRTKKILLYLCGEIPFASFFFFFVSTILGRDTKPLNLWNIFRGSSFVLAQIWSINHLLTFKKYRILEEVVKLTKHSWDFKVLILLFSVSPPLRFTYGI